MNIKDLYNVAKKYEEIGKEQASLSLYYGKPGRYINICAHLHREVSELWNAIRK